MNNAQRRPCELSFTSVVMFELGVLDRLMSSVEQQQRKMTSRGLLDVGSCPEDGEPEGRLELSTRELKQLSHRVQLWPLMEKLAVLNQLRLSNDLLHLAFAPGYCFFTDSEMPRACTFYLC